MKKIIVAIDSFKGCLTSEEAERAVKNGITQAIPECEVVCLPVSDGGEGIVSVLVRLSKGHYRQLEVTGPCGGKVCAQYGLSGTDDDTAFIELASAAGLPLVPLEKRNPLLTTTRGAGEIIMAALRQGKRHIIIGIGGSATNDAGTGLLSALGFCFLDKDGNELPGNGSSLSQITSIDTSRVSPLVKNANFEIVCDVNNPFSGKQGAAYIFAPQKGADTRTVEMLDKGLRAFARVIEESTGKDISALPGAGAAGGTGGGLAAFLNARLHPGIDFILDALNFNTLLSDTDLVISGEGHVDRQSAMGKVISGILRRTRPLHMPLVLLCGGYEDIEELNRAGITAVFSIIPSPVSLAKAMDKTFALHHLTETARQVCNLLLIRASH